MPKMKLLGLVAGLPIALFLLIVIFVPPSHPKPQPASNRPSPFAFMHTSPWSSHKDLGPETFEPLTFLIKQFKYYCPRVVEAKTNGIGSHGKQIVAFCANSSFEIMFNPDTNKVVVIPYY